MNRPQKSDAGRLDGCQNPKRDRRRVSDRSLCPHTTAYEKSGHCRIEEIQIERKKREKIDRKIPGESESCFLYPFQIRTAFLNLADDFILHGIIIRHVECQNRGSNR